MKQRKEIKGEFSTLTSVSQPLRGFNRFQTLNQCIQGVRFNNEMTSNHKLTRASAEDDAGSPILPAASKLEVEDLSSG